MKTFYLFIEIACWLAVLFTSVYYFKILAFTAMVGFAFPLQFLLLILLFPVPILAIVQLCRKSYNMDLEKPKVAILDERQLELMELITSNGGQISAKDPTLDQLRNDRDILTDTINLCFQDNVLVEVSAGGELAIKTL